MNIDQELEKAKLEANSAWSATNSAETLTARLKEKQRQVEMIKEIL